LPATEISGFVAAMPKVELHVHLIGAMAIDTAPLRFRSFADFATTYGRWQRQVRTGEDVATAVAQLAQRLAASRVRYAEVTVTPLPHLGAGIEPDELAEALDSGRRTAAADHGVPLGWIFDISGDGGEHAGQATVDWVLRYAPRGTVGFGLGGPETGVPRALFRPAFERAIAAGLRSVPHAGECAGPDSVWSALTDLRADRIGHGIQSVHDPALLDRLARENVALEVCPTSNVCTGAVRALTDHPLPALLEAEIPVTLATDNPAIFNTDLDREYVLAHDAMGLGHRQLIGIAATGIEVAFCEPGLKERLRAELRRFAAEHGTGAA
jgi:aminodeoxyfutalosine deaminase